MHLVQRASTCELTNTHIHVCAHVRHIGTADILRAQRCDSLWLVIRRSAGPLILWIEFSTNACSSLNNRATYANQTPNAVPLTWSLTLAHTSTSGPAHQLVLGVICSS